MEFFIYSIGSYKAYIHYIYQRQNYAIPLTDGTTVPLIYNIKKNTCQMIKETRTDRILQYVHVGIMSCTFFLRIIFKRYLYN